MGKQKKHAKTYMVFVWETWGEKNIKRFGPFGGEGFFFCKMTMVLVFSRMSGTKSVCSFDLVAI